jgi:hypothetical protein
MNERIQELAEQVEIYMGKDSYGKFAKIPGIEKGPINRQGMAESCEALEKFVQLIVRECADIANAGIDPTESHLIGNDILNHFGVK